MPKIKIWDGGMGTALALDPTIPQKVPGLKCNEELNLILPSAVANVHSAFLEAGADVVETNTFGANRITLAEFGLEDKVTEINIAAVKIAKKAIEKIPPLPPFSNGGKKRLISGSIGPTSKLPTLSHISFDEMYSAYLEQATALIKGGVDILQIETVQDILQAKIAVIACNDATKRSGKKIPVMVTVTIEPNGTTLLGTDISSAYVTLAGLGISIFGLNCGSGPDQMEEPLSYLSKYSSLPIAILPNAGMPEIVNGQPRYNLSPEEFAKKVARLAKKYNVACVGGCCGTTPLHIKGLSTSLSGHRTRPPKNTSLTIGSVTGLYSTVQLAQTPPPLIVGERMNINGSKQFREYLLAEDFSRAAGLAKTQADSGAHILDLSVAFAGRDEKEDIGKMGKLLSTISPLPLMIDSTSPASIEVTLKNLTGRPVINSINLEDGGKKATEILDLAIRYGADLVALTIDKEGMARTSAKKLSIAKKLIALCKKSGFFKCGGTLLIDLLTFTLADPNAATFGSGNETLKALKEIKKLQKKERNIKTILGVSNISYGLKPPTRRILNSLFLNLAVKAGLSAAIVHPAQITPLHKINKEEARLAENLILNKEKNALDKFVAYFEKNEPVQAKTTKKNLSCEDILKNKLLNGEKDGIAELIGELLKRIPPQQIINNILMKGMQKVGELFGTGEMPLPFVLQSAEVMRASVEILKPFMEGGEREKLGKIVIATVRGDVHDIGKNLVDIILSNNGFEVVNLGVKQGIESIISAIEKNKPDALGLSGLLVQSCLIMKEDLAELAHRGYKLPIICGGAALTRKFVDDELSKAYNNKVHYAKDAFDGLLFMNKLSAK